MLSVSLTSSGAEADCPHTPAKIFVRIKNVTTFSALITSSIASKTGAMNVVKPRAFNECLLGAPLRGRPAVPGGN